MFMLWVGRGGHEADLSRRDVEFYDVDLSLSAMVKARRSDHKQIQKLLRSLRSKLAIALIREPDVRRAVPARYRVYCERALQRLRQQAGLRWMVKTAAVLLIDDATASQWLANSPIGYQPMGETPGDQTIWTDEPLGESSTGLAPEADPLPPVGSGPASPMGHPPAIVKAPVNTQEQTSTTVTAAAPLELARRLHDLLGPFTEDVPQTLWQKGREVDPELSVDELLHVVSLMAPKATKGSPTGFVLRLLQGFLRGPSLRAYREELDRQRQARLASEKRDIAFWQQVLEDPNSDQESRIFAQDFLVSHRSERT
jgi:hypothetical protein